MIVVTILRRYRKVMKASILYSSAKSLKKKRLPPLQWIVLITLISLVSVHYGEDIKRLLNRVSFYDSRPLPVTGEEEVPLWIRSSTKDCDLFSGRWVRDKPTRPLYEEEECPYIQPQLTCQEHGRPDRDYQYWRWKPNACDPPSFNATMLLDALRGKKMMYVGDSLNRGQFTSMVCLLQGLLPHHAKALQTNGSLTTFTAKEYNATVEFYWAPFLLESNSDDAVVHRISDRVVRKRSIDKHGKHWKEADILIFNTYLWWMTGGKMKILRGSFEDQVKDIVEVSTEDAYRLAMKEMISWVAKNMDSRKTRVFFVTMSPTHSKSEDWGAESGGNCFNETKLIDNPTYWGSDSKKSVMQVIAEELSNSSFPITILNITQLSSYRKDSHTSIYKKQWSPLSQQQLDNPLSYADCIHWCLPGLQDTWNELLFAKLFRP